MSLVHLSVAGLSDKGKTKEHNEDALVVADLTGGTLLGEHGPRGRFELGDRGILLAVSDGIGGERAGEVASALVLESLTRAMAAAAPSARSDELIKQAVQAAHSEVWTAAQGAHVQQMGATLTAVYVHGEQTGTTAYIAEVGNSRAYLVRSGRITRLTRDQTFVQLMLDAGTMNPEEAVESTLSKVLLQAMGHRRPVEVALGKLELRNRDCLILCSDGMTRSMADDEIRDLVLGASSLSAACSSLVNLANARGGEDNITVIVAGVGGELAPSSATEQVNDTFEILESFDPRTRK